MATDAQVTALKLRQPSLPAIITDDSIKQYIDDAEVEFPLMGIDKTEPAYDKLTSLYALHLMYMANLISYTLSESVKDVSASYAGPTFGPGESIYYQEFKRSLRRRKYPYFQMFNS